MKLNRLKVRAVNGYAISSIFPFKVSPIYEETPVEVDKYYDRRGDAEKAALEDLYYYFKARDMKDKQSEYFEKLKNFDEEYPEWLI